MADTQRWADKPRDREGQTERAGERGIYGYRLRDRRSGTYVSLESLMNIVLTYSSVT